MSLLYPKVRPPRSGQKIICEKWKKVSWFIFVLMTSCAIWTPEPSDNQLESRTSTDDSSLSSLSSSSLSMGQNINKKKTIQTTEWTAEGGNRFWLQEEKDFHHFFDLAPLIDPQDQMINFFVVNPANAKIHYQYDLLSGKLIPDYLYCQKINWVRLHQKIPVRPPFTEGLIPRVLDQTGLPQRVFVFGRPNFYQSSLDHNEKASYMVKVIGGLIEEYCDQPPCRNYLDLEIRPIVVAIDPFDKNFQQITNMDQLKASINWQEVLNYLQYAQGIGYNQLYHLKEAEVVYRYDKEITVENIFKNLSQAERLFNQDELALIRQTCKKLYDYTWDKLGKNINITELNAEVKIQKTTNNQPVVLQKNLPLKKELQDYLKNYGAHYQTCIEMVKHSPIEENEQRHWFFSFFSAYFKLHKIGYFYDCQKKHWKKKDHFFVKEEHLNKNFPFQNLDQCNLENLDAGFVTALELLKKLKEKMQRSFRYIEYNNELFAGDHQKIYSWVLDNNKLPLCHEDGSLGRGNKKIYPRDVAWKRLFAPKF